MGSFGEVDVAKEKNHWVWESVSSVAHSCLTLRLHGLQHARLLCPSPTPGAYSNSCPSSWWCIQPSQPLSSPSPPAFNLPIFRVFSMSQFFAKGGQSIGVSASTSVLPMNMQVWFPLRWTALILQSRGLSRVFSTTQFKSINSLALNLLYSPALISVQEYWKSHTLD